MILDGSRSLGWPHTRWKTAQIKIWKRKDELFEKESWNDKHQKRILYQDDPQNGIFTLLTGIYIQNSPKIIYLHVPATNNTSHLIKDKL
jgi:hypothetical protein